MDKRLYEIAKELNVESREIIARMGEVGIKFCDHRAVVDKVLEEKIKEVFKKLRVGDIEVTQVHDTVKRRRTIKETPQPEPVAPVVQTQVEAAESEVEKRVEIPEREQQIIQAMAVEQTAVEQKAAQTKATEVPPQFEDEIPIQKQLVIIEGRKEEKEEKKEEEKVEVKTKEKKLLKVDEKAEKRTKGRRLIYDRRRDVFSLRELHDIVELELPPVPKKKKVVKGKKAQKQIITIAKPSKRLIKMTSDVIQVGELARIMGVKSGDVVKKLMGMGMMVSVVNNIDFDTAYLVAQEFGYTIEKAVFDIRDYIKEVPDRPKDLEQRAPVVTIMGHVDHGKTTLLDRIRETRVAEAEAGGITQHIGAYRVHLPKGEITFLDTPGHEAFTAMRARGAKVTDIVVLVVAADDGVKAQTVEAINHAKEAEVPIIVAINKIDKPEANVEKVKKELMDYNLVPEEWGGNTIFVEISAKYNRGIENLLEMILLQAEMLELKANSKKLAKGVVLESRLDKGKGPVATVIIQEGTLRMGDLILCGMSHGRVRLLIDDTGKGMKEVKPSQPAIVVGWDVPPKASEIFNALDDEKKIKPILEHLRLQQHKEKAAQVVQRISLEDLYKQIQMGVVKDLKIVLKTDVQGSLEALQQSISKLTHPEINVKIIHSGIGNITESDVNLALASSAIIIGFQVNVEHSAREIAEREKVDVKLYSIIYDVVDDIRNAMEGLLAPKIEEKLIGKVEIRQIFNISKIGKIAGCFVLTGRVVRGSNVKVMRNGEKVFEGKLNSLKRFKEDVKEVKQGFECGMSFVGFEEFEAGDIVEIYEEAEVQQRLNI